jgi:membrane protein YqaA with SNARE-associated domain
VKISPASLFNNWNAALLAFLKPMGVWGIGAIALIDTASIPMPIDYLLIDEVAHDHPRFVLYCLLAALGSAIGSLVPYYLGRAGGEIFLLKRINRQRYEQLRDRFEKQEFFAIMIPAMMPPPMPVKLFELAAGVFEMKPVWYFAAIFCGKFLRFMVWAILVVTFGPTILREIARTMHNHMQYVLAGAGVLIGFIVFYVVRKLFDRRRGTKFPIEDEM